MLRYVRVIEPTEMLPKVLVIGNLINTERGTVAFIINIGRQHLGVIVFVTTNVDDVTLTERSEVLSRFALTIERNHTHDHAPCKLRRRTNSNSE